jgi:hypothetical protein
VAKFAAKMAGAASLDLGVQMPSASGHGWLPHVFLFVAFFSLHL